MVHVSVTVDTDDCLVVVRATGHVGSIGGPHGANVVCAAVTAVIVACGSAIAANRAIESDGSAPEEGDLTVRVVAVGSGQREFLRGVTAVLVTGIRSLAADSPSEVEISVTRK